MIERYTRPEMAKIWSEENKLEIWLKIELLALEGMAKEGLIPEAAYKNVAASASINPKRAAEIEKETRHDVIAFLTSISESAGKDGRFLHRGMTSNDLLDTALGFQFKQAGELILTELKKLKSTLKSRALEFKNAPCIGRSHGIHAEPTTFGLKLLSWYDELNRREAQLIAATKLVAVGKIAGAVGTYTSVTPKVEEHVLKSLGLGREDVPSQVVHRDRHAQFFSSLALLGSSIERFAVELRHLQRTEVAEVEEGFTKGQKGSSAMPHKKNPISAENITGLTRLLRGYSLSALENVPLWHERDISHSSVERVIAPDACTVAHYMLWRMNELVTNLVVKTDRMLANLDHSKGIVFSGSLLIALTDKGMVRDDAYKVVQTHALAAWEGGEDFKKRILSDKQIVSFLTQAEIEAVFDLNKNLQRVDEIFERVLKKE